MYVIYRTPVHATKKNICLSSYLSKTAAYSHRQRSNHERRMRLCKARASCARPARWYKSRDEVYRAEMSKEMHDSALSRELVFCYTYQFELEINTECQKYRIKFNTKSTYYSELGGISNHKPEEIGESPKQFCVAQAACMHNELARLKVRPYEHKRAKYKEARLKRGNICCRKYNYHLIWVVSTRGVSAIIMAIKLTQSSRAPKVARLSESWQSITRRSREPRRTLKTYSSIKPIYSRSTILEGHYAKNYNNFNARCFCRNYRN